MSPPTLCVRSLQAGLIWAAIWSGAAQAASEPSFYKLHGEWEKKNHSSEPGSPEVDRAFGAALRQASSPADFQPAHVPDPIRKTLADLEASQTVTLQLSQSLLVALQSAPRKYIATQEGVVGFEPLGADTLRIEGLGIGQTFVHIWDATQRHTFQVLVRQQILSPELGGYAGSSLQRLGSQTRSFKLNYNASRSAYYQSEKFSELTRSTLDSTQRVGISGDTPYGSVAARTQLQSQRAKYIVTDAQAQWLDGRMGSFKEFDASAGDTQVGSGLMAFPGTRIRGLRLDHHPEKKRVEWSGFYGREQNSIIGTLTPGLTSTRTRSSFLGGGEFKFKLNDSSDLRAGYYNGHGRSRTDELNRHAFAVRPQFRLGPHVILDTETGYDNERFAHKHTTSVLFERFSLRSELRDIHRDFQSLTGSASSQGEVGHVLQIGASPTDRIRLEWLQDIFRDRLVPNPENPDRFNFHNDASVQWTPLDRTSAMFTYQNNDDTGRIGPTKNRSLGVYLTQGFDLAGRPSSVFARYQNQGSRNLTNSLSDYTQNRIAVGFNMRLFWDLRFNIQKEWSLVEEPNLRRLTHPHTTTYSLDSSSRLWGTPFYLDLSARYRDEEKTDSPYSFSSGEDAAELSGGLYYRESEDWEVFLTGNLSQYRTESPDGGAPRTEGQFLTGVRMLLDTGWTLESTGNIEGVVYKDIDGDGKRSETEPGLSGIKVSVSGGPSGETDTVGLYRIKGVRGKQATVQLDSSDIPAGYSATTALVAETQIVNRGTSRIDFGLAPRSEISGIIFEDRDGDRRYSSPDVAVSKARVHIDDGKKAQSSNSGAFFIAGVRPGERTATLDLTHLPQGYLPIGSVRRKFTLEEGMRYEIQFPLKAQRTVTGRVYEDLDGNGGLGPGDRPIQGVRVLCQKVQSVSDKDGYYLLENLLPGSARITVDPATLPAGLRSEGSKVEIAQNPTPLESVHLNLRREQATDSMDGGNSIPPPAS